MSNAAGGIEISNRFTPAILAHLHQDGFEQPWTETALADLAGMPGSICLVAALDGNPLGFVLARQAADEAEILTICVVNTARRQGISRRLLECLLGRLGHVSSLFLEVEAGNEPARMLYESCGFHQAGVRKGYYAKADGTTADALVLKRQLNDDAPLE